MAPSKFVEILDTIETPYSQANVSLEDVLAETRQRSDSSTSNRDSTDKSPSRERGSSATSAAQPQIKTRLRGFSIKKAKT